MVAGTKGDAQALKEEIAGVLTGMGLRLSPEKDPDHPHRRGPRLPRLAHPAPPQARHRPVLRLHLPVTQSRQGRDREGQDDVPGHGHEPAARCPAAPTQPGAPGLVRIPPARRVQPHLRLPELLHVAAGRQLAAAQTSPECLERPPPPLLRRRLLGAGAWPCRDLVLRDDRAAAGASR